MPVLRTPLNGAKFTLDISGVAGFFGGEEAISAMAAIHLFKGRKYLGWYNSPGSYIIAKRFGQIAASRHWDGLFPGPNETPAVSFGLDGRQGPKYVGSLSGTVMQSGHLGYLMMQEAKEEKVLEVIDGRTTSLCYVAFLELKDIKHDGRVPQRPIDDALLALIPIVASFAACITCAMFADWYCSSMILLGVFSNGLICLVIGSGKLSFVTVKEPAPGSPPGDGMLIGDDTVIVVTGAERDVNAITKGKFQVKIRGEPTYHNVGLCSLLLLVQFLSQLLLIPQGTLFGQTMFLGTFAVSWLYNSHLSSLEKEKIQAKILFEMLDKPGMQKYRLGTRTTMAAFACLLVCDGKESPYDGIDPEELLRNFISNNTQVWKRWRNKVIQQMKENRTSFKSPRFLQIDQDDRSNLGEGDIKLLTGLLGDARSAFKGYIKHFASTKPEVESQFTDTSALTRGG